MTRKEKNMDLESIIKEMGVAFEGFKAKWTGRVESLENAIARGQFSLGGGSVSFGGGGAVDTAAVKEHLKAFSGWSRNGADAGLRSLEVKASMSTLEDPAGGYMVPSELAQEIEKHELEFTPMRRLATVKPISTPDYKKIINKGGLSSGWVAEKDSRPETGTPELSAIQPVIGELYANPAVTQRLLDDSAFDVENWLVESIGEEFTLQEGAAFITGNGVGRPKGILAYDKSANPDSTRTWDAIQYVAGGHASLLNNADKLFDLVHALRAPYRQGAAWLMNSSTVNVIRKMKDGNGTYIWRDGLEAGTPSTLLGYPVEVDENMPDIAANAFPVAFGNWKRSYLIVDRVGIRVLRDSFTNKPYVHFYTTKRLGAAVQNHQSYKLLKIAVS